MPRAAEVQQQHSSIFNPYEDKPRRISEFTATEIAALQCRLDKQLGPEYISTRPGANGGKVHYLAAEKVINLANSVFSFNGWSSSIQNVQVDFVDEAEHTGKVSLGLSIIVRVTLKDGTYHEDIGYGHIENCKGKAAAFEKAKKEAATDALKRALRNFGNVLGNCLYDKDYLTKVTKVKIAPAKWDADNLHRHPDYAIERTSIGDENRGAPTTKPPPSNRVSDKSMSTAIEDDFGGGNLFDDVELGEGHPDEVELFGHGEVRKPSPHPEPAPPPVEPHLQSGAGQSAPQAKSKTNWTTKPNNLPGQSGTRSVNPRPSSPEPALHQQPSNSNSIPPNPPQTPGNTDFPRPDSEAHQLVPTGFVSVRSASKPSEPLTPGALQNLPVFNPTAQSPSIPKTTGVDHSCSRPIRRDTIQTRNDTDTAVQTRVSGLRVGANQAQQQTPSAPPNIIQPPQTVANRNFINPALDTNRRIGAPHAPQGLPVQTGISSPGPTRNNAAAYKRPGPASSGMAAAGVKRPHDDENSSTAESPIHGRISQRHTGANVGINEGSNASAGTGPRTPLSDVSNVITRAQSTTGADARGPNKATEAGETAAPNEDVAKRQRLATGT